ncbi:hypothetical protein ACIBI4_09260 [Streptomyces sp. NPDC050418]|uniref:hypothetical protein n=1 Tax=Streptomyces sp. NPDC050418 TaxID=3365612 RepID=UPI0037BC09D4
MADEYDRWLTKDAAERLLRGEPLDAVDDARRAHGNRNANRNADGSRTDGSRSNAGPNGSPADGAHPGDDPATRLARALDAVRPSTAPAPGELPGEAAALAAFRAAGHGSAARAPQGVRAGDGTRELSAVSFSPEPGLSSGTPGRTGRGGAHAAPGRTIWGRPLRFGVAAALAVCTIGGVAVAAGTGVLPTPFGGGDPSPATSVSAEASAQPASPLPDITSPDGSDAPSTTPGEPDESGDGRGADSGGGSEGGRDEDKDDDRGEDRQGDWSKGDWYVRMVQSCRDHQAGRPLDGDRRKRLVSAAKGSERVAKFCADLLEQDEDRGSGGSSGEYGGSGSGSGGGSGDEDGDGSGEEGGSSGGDGEGEIPPPESSGAPEAPDPTPTTMTNDPSPTATDDASAS